MFIPPVLIVAPKLYSETLNCRSDLYSEASFRIETSAELYHISLNCVLNFYSEASFRIGTSVRLCLKFVFGS